MPLIYEVNLDVDSAIAPEYLAWLEGHVGEICALPGFLGAERWEVRDPPPEEGRMMLSVRYVVADQDALDRYFREHAPRLRGDGIARFGERFRASRRVLRPAAAVGSPVDRA